MVGRSYVIFYFVSDNHPFCNETANDASDLLHDLDNIFNDDYINKCKKLSLCICRYK